MAQITVIKATESPVLHTDAASLFVDSSGYDHITVSADDLGGSEEVDIYALAGNTYRAVTDQSGNIQRLTSSIPFLRLESGPTYRFAKDATPGSPCAVYVNLVAK